MNVLLVKPYCLSDHIQPPLGLGYLANAVRKKHSVRIVDCLKEGIASPGQLFELIKSFKPDVVGMQCYTLQLKFIKETFREIKKLDPRILCVIGGPHPSAVPQESMEWFGELLDYGFTGEAERSFARFLDEVSSKTMSMDSVPGLIWKKDGRIACNPPELVEDLDSLGDPCWDILKPQTYPESQHGAFYMKFPIAPITVTRGCPYPCTFCAGKTVSGRKIRKHSIDYVLRQIRLLHDDYHIREFHIIDDNFTFDLNYAKSLLRGLKDLELDISWATPNGIRVDKIDDELLGLMKETGLYLVSLGIESGSDRVLQAMKKHITVAGTRAAVRMIRKHGIDVAGFFIIGFPGETREDIEKTIKFACELDLIRANFFTYLPFPGTESYHDLLKKGELAKVDYESFYFMSAPYVPQGLTRKELKMFHRKAFIAFFMRPKIFIKNVRSIKSLRHLRFIMMRFYNWMIRG